MNPTTRRTFLSTSMTGVAACVLPGRTAWGKQVPPRFEISLAEWSLHRTLRAGKITNLDFPVVAKKEFGIHGVEYVNTFFKDKANDTAYLTELKKRCDDNGVRSVLIMCDGEGHLGDANETKRNKAVTNHHRWVEAAKFLGCHSIRVNARSNGSREEQRDRAAEGLRALSEFAAKHQINVIVENHGGLSSNGQWLAEVMKKVNLPNCGTLPDFGNFHGYDRYKGVEETLPFAKGLSAKSHEFDADGNETRTDFKRMMELAIKSGYRGYVGIEYEGGKVSEYEGIRLTKTLLERTFKTLNV